MDQHRIRCVLATGETGSITRAANLLYSSPQHVKDEVDAAERELGCALFIRSHKGCTPTEAGAVFMREGETIAKTLDTFCDAVSATASSTREVRVQSFEGKEIPVLDEICLRFREAHPDITLTFVNTTGPRMLDDLIEGVSDVGFYAEGTPYVNRSRLQSRTCRGLTMGLRIIASKDDPILFQDSIAGADLAGRNLAFCGVDMPAELSELPIGSVIPWERYAILNHCATDGLCVVDEYMDVRSPLVATVPLEDVAVQICCLFRPNPPEPVRRFLEMTDII